MVNEDSVSDGEDEQLLEMDGGGNSVTVAIHSVTLNAMLKTENFLLYAFYYKKNYST
jgi:hypothetical protein